MRLLEVAWLGGRGRRMYERMKAPSSTQPGEIDSAALRHGRSVVRPLWRSGPASLLLPAAAKSSICSRHRMTRLALSVLFCRMRACMSGWSVVRSSTAWKAPGLRSGQSLPAVRASTPGAPRAPAMPLDCPAGRCRAGTRTGWETPGGSQRWLAQGGWQAPDCELGRGMADGWAQ